MTSDQFENHSISIDAVLYDRSASNWLKDSLRSAIKRDPVDAANDAEVLARLLAEQADKVAQS